MNNPQLQQLRAAAEAGKADAQFVLSQLCLQEQDLEGMRRWLEKASAQGYAEAIAALGYCYEKGQGVPPDAAMALEHYDRAAEAGSPVAACHKAQLLYKSRRGPELQSTIFGLLVAAAAANIVPALRTIGFLAANAESKHELAVRCWRRAAALGDPVSAFFLGCSHDKRPDIGLPPGEAKYYLRVAANADYPFAREMLAGIDDGLRQPAVDEHAIDFGECFEIYPQPRDIEKEEFSSDPAIAVMNDVLDVADRSYLIYLARPFMRRAHVINPDGDKSGMVSQVRTNASTYIPFEIVDTIARFVELKIIAATGESLSSSEPMSILWYGPGQYYRPHVDYFNPKLDVSAEFLREGGQRTASAVTYLVAPGAGGGTSFPRLDLTVPPAAGCTLWFRNCLYNGEVDERSLHAGDEVTQGEKWVVTKWFREGPTDYLQI